MATDKRTNGISRRSLAWSCLGTCVVSAFVTSLILLAPWGEFGGIDEEAWLSFWGTLFSAVSAAGVATAVLLSQLRKQEEQHESAISVQRDEARKEREIMALAQLNAVLANGYTDYPSSGREWQAIRDQRHQELEAAVANWKMNWDVDKADDIELDFEFTSAGIALSSAYLVFPLVGTEQQEVEDTQLAFARWSRFAGTYVNASKRQRRDYLLEWTETMRQTTVSLAQVMQTRRQS